MTITRQSEKTVRQFLKIIRSGKSPERASEFMADTVKAHQLNSEFPETVLRTPQNYTAHVHDFLRAYGTYQFEITQLIASGDKVYARWKQTGKQIDDMDSSKATGLPVTEIGSAVYRVHTKNIVEYWVQIDRKGSEIQQQLNSKAQNNLSKITVPFSAFCISKDTLYISGQIGLDQNGQLVNTGFEVEAKQVMENLGTLLRQNKLSYSNLINVTFT